MEITDFQNGFRWVCFQHHERKCIVCGEDGALDVHHLNEIETDQSPENVVPLCPTHHRYLHSHWPEDVQPAIEQYFKNWTKLKRDIILPDLTKIEKRCCVCGEEKLVNIVPLDGDETNSATNNIVPLCPTHQAYYNGKRRPQIQTSVDEYVKKNMESMG